MYNYIKFEVGQFYLFLVAPKKGAEHKRMFNSGVNSLNQYTANLYLNGEFSLINSQNGKEIIKYHSGETSIDHNVEYPSDVVIIERVISENAYRACLEPIVKGSKWTRVIVDKGETITAPKNSAFFPLTLIPGQETYSPKVYDTKTENVQFEYRTLMAIINNQHGN